MNTNDTVFDLTEYWAIAKRRIWLWLLPLVVVTGTAVAISFFLTPRYKAVTKLLIDESSAPGFSTGTTPEDARTEARRIPLEIKNPYMWSRIASSLRLDTLPHVVENVADLKSKYAAESDDRLLLWYLTEDLGSRIDVQVYGPSIVWIWATDEDPQLAARMADELASIFSEVRRARDIGVVRMHQSFVYEQMAIWRQKKVEAEEGLADFQQQSLESRFDEDLLRPSNVTEILTEKNASSIELENLRKNRMAFESQLSQYDYQVTKWRPSQEIRRQVDNLLLDISSYSSLLGRFPWTDPTIVALNSTLVQQLSRIKTAINTEVARDFVAQSPSFQNSLGSYSFSFIQEEMLKRKISILNRSIQQLKTATTKGPSYELALTNLQQEVEHARTIYQSFVNQITSANIQQAWIEAESQDRIRVLEQAMVPLEPVYPQKLRIALMGLALGLLIGGAVVLAVELSDHSFRNPEEVEPFLKTSVLGSMPRLAQGKLLK